MKRSLARFAVFAGMVLAPLWAAEGGTVHGTVNNGTTGKPATGVEVILIQLQGGMQPVANTKSDAKGEFAFDNPGLGAQPMLVRAVYRGVNFHQPVPPGSSNVQVNIFESSTDAKIINVPSHVVVFQPNGSTLIVGEEYQIENKSQPPQAYFRADGNFDFSLPERAQLQQVAASGPTGMPVVQAPSNDSEGFDDLSGRTVDRGCATNGSGERARTGCRRTRAGNESLRPRRCSGGDDRCRQSFRDGATSGRRWCCRPGATRPRCAAGWRRGDGRWNSTGAGATGRFEVAGDHRFRLCFCSRGNFAGA